MWEKDRNMNNVDWSAGSIDNVFFSETGGDRGLSPITFSSLLSTSPYEVMRFGGEADAISTVDKLKSSIENILSYLVRPENAAEFSIAQMEGHWYGSGVQNYIEALDRQHQRYKRDYNDYKSHNSERQS